MSYSTPRLLNLAGTTAVPIINKTTFSQFKIPLPPLPEQEKIAEILSTVDAKIALITQRITQTQDLKKGLMQRLLTKGIGHTEFKECRLDEIFNIARGGSPRPIKDYITESEEGYNWIKIGDTKNVDKFIYSTKQKIRKEGLEKSRLVKKNDFILSNSCKTTSSSSKS